MFMAKYKKYKNDETGATAHDPKKLLTIVLLALFKNYQNRWSIVQISHEKENGTL